MRSERSKWLFAMSTKLHVNISLKYPNNLRGGRMKIFKLSLVVVLSLFAVSAFAGEMEIILGVIAPFLKEYVIKFPLLGTIINVMITSRIVVKPLMSALMTIYKDKPQFTFLSFTVEVTEAKWYKSLAFILDWLLSIKLPKEPVK